MMPVGAASILFGDILTDIAAIITGSMGIVLSGNIEPERRFPSMFEPVYGRAPDITGKGIPNPLAAILSEAMVMRYLGEGAASDTVERAALSVIEPGETLQPDLGGPATTEQVGNAVVSELT